MSDIITASTLLQRMGTSKVDNTAGYTTADHWKNVDHVFVLNFQALKGFVELAVSFLNRGQPKNKSQD